MPLELAGLCVLFPELAHVLQREHDQPIGDQVQSLDPAAVAAFHAHVAKVAVDPDGLWVEVFYKRADDWRYGGHKGPGVDVHAAAHVVFVAEAFDAAHRFMCLGKLALEIAEAIVFVIAKLELRDAQVAGGRQDVLGVGRVGAEDVPL